MVAASVPDARGRLGCYQSWRGTLQLEPRSVTRPIAPPASIFGIQLRLIGHSCCLGPYAWLQEMTLFNGGKGLIIEPGAVMSTHYIQSGRLFFVPVT
jgi:hypothetical protein